MTTCQKLTIKDNTLSAYVIPAVTFILLNSSHPLYSSYCSFHQLVFEVAQVKLVCPGVEYKISRLKKARGVYFITAYAHMATHMIGSMYLNYNGN